MQQHNMMCRRQRLREIVLNKTKKMRRNTLGPSSSRRLRKEQKKFASIQSTQLSEDRFAGLEVVEGQLGVEAPIGRGPVVLDIRRGNYFLPVIDSKAKK